MENKVWNILRPILRILCAIVLGVAVMVIFFLGVLKNTLLNRDFFRDSVVDDQYIEAVVTQMNADLLAQCLFYDIPLEVITDVLDETTIREYSEEYLDRLFISLTHKQTLEKVSFSTEPIRDAIDGYIDEQLAADPNLTADEGIADQLAEVMTNIVSSAMSPITEPVILENASKYFFAQPLAHMPNGVYLWLIAGAVVLLIAVTLLGKPGTWMGRLYLSLSAVWCGATICFVPIWLFRMYDLPSRLVLGESILKSLLDHLLYATIDRWFFAALWLFVLVSIALLAVILGMVFYTKPMPQDE